MTRATTRTCDAMGVCQGHAQPCAGCMPAPRRSHRICSADQCQQGRSACPCPTACELPEHTLRDEPITTPEAVLMWVIVSLSALIVAAVVLASAA